MGPVVLRSLDEKHLTMAASKVLMVFMLTTIVFCQPTPIVKRSALSAGDGESIQAYHGFYGNPIYRPYGFGSWGWGSEGFGYNTIVSRPNVYGGYYFAG
eukprot:TRINITY_DN25013_c0_g1_i1.p1 TRINITY_DN25013_c0_g1~~TRINITY_DN25013_c0_g1_i1.p1  ORF type:complete len:113 (-),score=29.37 TRINITY_DN25013_c0_g1_i1:202-498(-)